MSTFVDASTSKFETDKDEEPYNYMIAALDGEEDDVPGPAMYKVQEAFGYQYVSKSRTEPSVMIPKTNHCDWMKVLITKGHDARNEKTVCAPGPIYETPSGLNEHSGRAFTKASTHRGADELGADVPAYKRMVPMYEVCGNIEAEAKVNVKFGKDAKFPPMPSSAMNPGPGEYEVRGNVSTTAGRSFGAGRESRMKMHPGHKGMEILGATGPGPGNEPKNLNHAPAVSIPKEKRMKDDAEQAKIPGPGAYVIKRGLGVDVLSADRRQAGIFLGPPARSRREATTSVNEYFRNKSVQRLKKQKFKPRFTWAGVARRGNNVGLQFR